MLSALAAHAALRGITTSDGDALKATGRAPLLARLSLFKAILVVPALIIGAQHSAAAAAWALSGAALLAAAVTIAMTMRILHVPLFDILRAYLPGAAGSVIMAAVLVPWLHWSEPFNATVQVAGGILLGGAVYTLAVALIDRDLFVRARRHFLTRVPTGGEAHS
ncbi:MAG: polysaccharide biosynthesis C-terminal domain-containing protein [Thermoanaerobaculia bacterium]